VKTLYNDFMRKKVIRSAWRGESIIGAALNIDKSVLKGMVIVGVGMLITAAIWSLFF